MLGLVLFILIALMIIDGFASTLELSWWVSLILLAGNIILFGALVVVVKGAL